MGVRFDSSLLIQLKEESPKILKGNGCMGDLTCTDSANQIADPKFQIPFSIWKWKHSVFFSLYFQGFARNYSINSTQIHWWLLLPSLRVFSGYFHACSVPEDMPTDLRARSMSLGISFLGYFTVWTWTKVPSLRQGEVIVVMCEVQRHQRFWRFQFCLHAPQSFP